ncbi:hypothetical protein [Streptomyces sp. NPDC005407]|uniref:hypothetical protein n=1 Tax=Streptomyces sp. NPDC005407 TaxID=3155340 RepID=UPI0033B3DA77
MSPSPPATTPALYEAWEALADGLHVQRLALYLEPLRDLIAAAPAEITLFTEATPAALTARPAPLTEPQAFAAIEGAGLSHWVDLPSTHGTNISAVNPLTATGDQVAEALLDAVTDQSIRAAIEAVSAASAWWIGTFAAIRHLGVHHTTLQPVADQVTLDTLRAATRTVALGTAIRVLQHQLRTTGGDEKVRLAYCRAITEAIVCESGLPALLEDLGELRLVDLVGTSIPWRGRFTKYAGGTGAGQVE